MPSEACVEELETLSAIFLSEIIVNDAVANGGAQVSMILYPATADDEESRYVTLTLELSLCNAYPKLPPKIVFRNPRGLNEVMLEELMKSMEERCEDRLESQMIYELIDMGKEFLTKNNRPASECPICLLSFTEFDVFFRTRCFHHFHSHCLGNYLHNIASSSKDSDRKVRKEKPELTCPVCREGLEEDIDIEKLVESPPPSEELEGSEGNAYNVLQEWKDKKEIMKKMFEKQKSQGGIIDLTESKKLLVISSDRESSTTELGPTARSEAGGSANANATSTSPQRHATADSGPQSQTSIRQRNNGQYQYYNKNNSGRPRVVPNNSKDLPQTAAGTNSTVKAERVSAPPNNASSACPDAKTDQAHGHYRKFQGGRSYNRRRNK